MLPSINVHDNITYGDLGGNTQVGVTPMSSIADPTIKLVPNDKVSYYMSLGFHIVSPGSAPNNLQVAQQTGTGSTVSSGASGTGTQSGTGTTVSPTNPLSGLFNYAKDHLLITALVVIAIIFLVRK